jgi:hypothetical protein
MNGAARPRTLVPLLYFGTAYVSLALACALAALWPRAVAGFFYHSWMVALVHLITLGWITFSLLGTLYSIGPLTLRASMPMRRGDYFAYGLAVTGVVGMVAHFWIEEFGGMAWSAATVTAGVLYVVTRIVRGLRRRDLADGPTLLIAFACVNIVVAASMGILLGFDKAFHFLPGFVLANVFAHAHLAALGWATMITIGVAYRLLPGVAPGRMPAGRLLSAGAIVLEASVAGLFVSLLFQSRWTVFFGIVVASTITATAAHLIWTLRSRAPKPADGPRIDFALLHAGGAGVSLLVAIGLGLALVVAPLSPFSLQAAAAYGVFGLVGFLAQMVVAFEVRLWPLRDAMLRAVVFLGWTVGVPALAAGLFLESATFVAAGAWALLASLAIATLNAISLVAPSLRRETGLASPDEVSLVERPRRLNTDSASHEITKTRKTSIMVS